MEKEFGERTKKMSILTDMKVNTSKIRSMGKEYFTGKVAMYIKDAILKMKDMAMEKCILRMALYIKEIGKRGFKVDQEK